MRSILDGKNDGESAKRRALVLIPSLAVPLGAAGLAVSIAKDNDTPVPTAPEALRDVLPQSHLAMVALDRKPSTAPRPGTPRVN